jgi:hypothetical protein
MTRQQTVIPNLDFSGFVAMALAAYIATRSGYPQQETQFMVAETDRVPSPGAPDTQKKRPAIVKDQRKSSA